MPSNIGGRAVDRVEAMKHLDRLGVLSGLDLDDNDGMAIRAAANLLASFAIHRSRAMPRSGRR